MSGWPFYARQDASGRDSYHRTEDAAYEWAAHECLKNEQVDIFKLVDGEWKWLGSQITVQFDGAK